MSQSKVLEENRRRLFAGMGVPEPAPFVPDDFQRNAVNSVMEGSDTLVVAPTGSGKTYIAIESIRSMLELGVRAVYTTPLKALSNTKYAELKHLFEPRWKVGLLTGDRKIDTDASVVIATTEIYRNELYNLEERYSLVVLDEVHFIADSQRGPVWEESIILTPASTTLLMLSASISNSTEICDWIGEVRGKTCRLITEKKRSVEQRLGFIHPEFGVLPVEDEQGRLLKEVSRFYGSSGLDPSGMRLTGGRFSKPNRSGGRRGRK